MTKIDIEHRLRDEFTNLFKSMETKLDKIIDSHQSNKEDIISIKDNIIQNTKDIHNGNESLIEHMKQEEKFWEKVENKFETKLDNGLFWKIFGAITSGFIIITSFLFNQIDTIRDNQVKIHDGVTKLETLIK